MDKTFGTLDEIKSAVYGSVWVTNGDPALVEDSDVIEDVATDIWGATEYGASPLREVVEAEEFEYAKTSLGLEKNVVRHIYKYSADYITSYIAFSADYDYCE